MAFASYKRFEQTGEITFRSLCNIAISSPLNPGHQVLRRWEHAGVGRRQFIAQTVLTHTNGCAPNQLNFTHSVRKIASTTIAPILKLNLAVVEAVLFAHDVEPRIWGYCRNR